MKNKIIKITLGIFAIVAIIYGINILINSEVNIMQSSISQNTALAMPGIATEPVALNSSKTYNTHTGTWEWQSSYGMTEFYDPLYSNFQIYCIQPGSALQYVNHTTYDILNRLVGLKYTNGVDHIGWGTCSNSAFEGWSTAPIYREIQTDVLTKAQAYIVSADPIGKWSEDKQRAIWNLEGNFWENWNLGETVTASLIQQYSGSYTNKSKFDGPSKYDDEAQYYAKHDEAVRDKGLNPSDKTSLSEEYATINGQTQTYTVGPFNVTYTNAIYGNIAFGGISDITVIGYNKDGKQVNRNIELESIIMADVATGVYGTAQVPQYFEPDANTKIDTSTQVYPKSGQNFKVVFKDPNANLTTNEEAVASVTIKIKFKYMLANGQATTLGGTKYVIADDHYHPKHAHRIWEHVKNCRCDLTEGVQDVRCTRKTIACTGQCTVTTKLINERQQYLVAVDADRTVYEQEIELKAKVNIEKPIDLALRKFITSINGVAPSTSRVPQISSATLKNLANGSTETATKTHTKNALEVEYGNKVVYTIRVYNEGEEDGYVKEITDYLPTGLNMVPASQSKINSTYGWKVSSDGRTATTTKLANTLLKAFNGSKLEYLDVQIECQVVATGNNITLKNVAEITTHSDSRGNTSVDDRDSTPKNLTSAQKTNYNPGSSTKGWGYQDDDDYENLIVKKKFTITGTVWEEQRSGKESVPDGTYKSGEKALEGISVILHQENGTVVSSTKTDAKGKYTFTKLDANKKYYVEFQYNGQEYENTVYRHSNNNSSTNVYSNGVEFTKDRDALNNKFKQIAGSISSSNTLISAYSSSDGKNGIQTYTGDNSKGEDIKVVNMGIVKRIEFDMSVKKDVYAATVMVNGKSQIYAYDKKNLGSDDGQAGDTWNIQVVGGYQRDIENTDYNFKGQNGNEQLLEVYITYKVAVRNQSQSMLGYITKLYDYYDSSYEYKPELSWTSSTNYTSSTETLNSLRDKVEAGSVTGFGSKPNVTENNNSRLTINIGKKQKTGETVYLYLTFKIKGEGSNLSLGQKGNSVEIGTFETYYKSGTVLPHYGTNSYKIASDNVVAGRIDKDSTPSTMKANGTPKEDDEDSAPGLNVKLANGTREINGFVWEDKRTKNVNGAIIGDGIRDNGEIGIAGVKVYLYEKVDGGYYQWAETVTDTNGKYSFKGVIPGDYFVEFLYGSDKKTALTKADGGLNDVSYNGQDYKSTIYQVGINQNGATDSEGKYKGYTDVNNQNASGTFGYDIAKADALGKNVSDAKDLWVSTKTQSGVGGREYIINYSNGNITNSKAEILASAYETPSYNGTAYTSAEKANLQNTLQNNTYMYATTGMIVMEIEYNKQISTENGNPNYTLANIDLGLTERPKAQLEIDKSISGIKVTLANNTVLFDVNKAGDNVIWQDHEQYNLASKKVSGIYKDYYGEKNKNRYSYRYDSSYALNTADRGIIQLTMDEELMHGATIQITYKVKVTNVSEVDYEGKKFYYLGDSSGASQVTTTANRVVDYVANNLKFDSSNSLNSGWTLTDSNKLTSQEFVNKKLTENLNKVNTILYTTQLNKVLKPGESTDEKTLVLTQMISTQNTSDDLTYNNIVEIVETKNTVGRRMAYSVVGNQNPTASKPAEIDSNVAETVIILPPFGDTHIYYILGIAIGIILIGGITLIIKKVLRK